LLDAVAQVVKSRMCSGCGACAARSQGLLEMRLDKDGFLTPSETAQCKKAPSDLEDTMLVDFEDYCPGKQVTRQDAYAAPFQHPIFGNYFSVWQGFATEPEVRISGSSGGVLSAIQMFMFDQSINTQIIAVGSSEVAPTHSVPVTIESKAKVMKSAGSRYAPSATLEQNSDDSTTVIVGKPCEIMANVAQHSKGRGSRNEPLRLSFYCAGVPSQQATSKILSSFDVDEKDVIQVDYRGGGWPGRFRVQTTNGDRHEMTYEESWGSFLGRNVQRRCKICPDGCGEFSDITVGDFWEADESGYPIFDDGLGNSVVLARTRRGHETLLLAAQAGILELKAVNLEDVAQVQPLQGDRYRNLPGRLMGFWLAGVKLQKMAGYGLTLRFFRHPITNIRNAFGAWARIK